MRNQMETKVELEIGRGFIQGLGLEVYSTYTPEN